MTEDRQEFPLQNEARPRKILCIVIIYYDFSIIQTCLNFLCTHNDHLDIIVVENRSKYTESQIKPYILKLIDSGQILQYFLFNKNISNNVLEVFFDDGHVDLASYDHVLLTDGDLLVEDRAWLSEELSILARYPEIFACGIKLDMANLPTRTFPEAVHWIPPVIEAKEMYEEVLTGVNLLMLRSAELRGFLDYRRSHGLKILDGYLHQYCYKVLKMKWARTVKSTAIHLTWNNYNDLENEYTQLKTAKTFHETWNHHSYASYVQYSKKGISKHVPWRKIIKGHFMDLYSLRWIKRYIKHFLKSLLPQGNPLK